MFSKLLLLAGTATTATSGAAVNTENVPWYVQYSSLIMLVLVFVVMYFLLIRPQKKRQKEEQQMRDDLRVGDEITTIGGILGRVVNVKEDSLIIETGADRNKLTIKKWAIQSNETVHEKPLDNDDDDDDDDDI